MTLLLRRLISAATPAQNSKYGQPHENHQGQRWQHFPHARPLAVLRRFVHTILCILLLLPLTVKAYDPDAGMVAARMLGEKKCLAFKINGQVNYAAVFWHDGHRYLYHPSKGSIQLPDDAHEAARWFRGCLWIPVLCVPRTANLENACVPFAIMQARATGGKVRLEQHYDGRTMQTWNHAEVVKR